MKKLLSNIESIMIDMIDENKTAAAIENEHQTFVWHYERTRQEIDKMRDGYGRELRSYVKRKTEKIVRENTGSWGTEVEVLPLHNGSDKTTTPLIKVEWRGRHGIIELSCWAQRHDQVDMLIERFRRIVMSVKETPIHATEKQETRTPSQPDHGEQRPTT